MFLGVWGFGIYGPLDLGSWGFLAVLWICGVCLKFWFWGLGALGFRVLGSFWRFFGSVWCFWGSFWWLRAVALNMGCVWACCEGLWGCLGFMLRFRIQFRVHLVEYSNNLIFFVLVVWGAL